MKQPRGEGWVDLVEEFEKKHTDARTDRSIYVSRSLARQLLKDPPCVGDSLLLRLSTLVLRNRM